MRADLKPVAEEAVHGEVCNCRICQVGNFGVLRALTRSGTAGHEEEQQYNMETYGLHAYSRARRAATVLSKVGRC